MRHTVSAIITDILIAFIALFIIMQLIRPTAQACDLAATPDTIQSGIIIHDVVPCDVQ